MAVAAVVLCATVTASSVRVTQYPTSASTQIWIDVADFDARSQDDGVNYDFVENPFMTGMLSGAAYWFPNYDGPDTLQPWWVEYSIDQEDVPVSLTGTWYFWARAKQLSSGVNAAEESNLVFVKNDPDDGSGANWYADALAGVDLTKDRILNDSVNRTTWVWASTNTDPIVAKQFIVDENGKIVFRISERESGLDNANIDAICWTNDPTFVPTDDDYNETPDYSTYGLVQYYSANQTDELAHLMWSPAEGIGNSGVLRALNGGPKPAYYVKENAGGYEFDYVLDPSGDSGGAVDLGGKFIPGYYDDFTVELWVRPDGVPVENWQQALWSTQAESSRGFRLYIHDTATPQNGTFQIGLEARDNNGTIQGQNRRNSTLRYTYGQWYQIVAVYDANSIGDGRADMRLYVNGELASSTGAFGDYLDDLKMYNRAALGCNYVDSANYTALNNKMYFEGGMALARIYNIALSADQVDFNYNRDKGWIIDELPYDPAVDPVYAPSEHFEIKNGLVSKYYGYDAGPVPHLAWKAQLGAAGGTTNVNPNSPTDLTPRYIPAVDGGGYEFNYELGATDTLDNGGYINLGNNYVADWDENITVEVWFRNDEIPPKVTTEFPNNNQQQTIWSTQTTSPNGMRFAISNTADPASVYRLRFENRDNTGSTVQWAVESANNQTSVGVWRQAVCVYEAKAHSDGIRPVMSLYIDGQLLARNTNVAAPPTDFNFLSSRTTLALGCNFPRSTNYRARDNKGYFKGGIALARVYNRPLSEIEILENYNHDKGWIKGTAPYNPADPAYNPGVAVHNPLGLVLELDGRDPGNNPDPTVVWDAQVGGPGRLYDIGSEYGIWPQYVSGENGGGYEFNYALVADANIPSDMGGAIIVDDAYVPDWDDNISVEVWFRNSEIPPQGFNQQQVIWSTQSVGANGMRFAIRNTSGDAGTYDIRFENRDNTGSTANWSIMSPKTQTSVDQWRQAVCVYEAKAVDRVRPVMQIYIDGQLLTQTASVAAPPTDFDFVSNPPVFSLGSNYVYRTAKYQAKDEDGYFNGGIALVRVYDRILTAAEVANNYALDKGWISEPVGGPYDESTADFSVIPLPARCDLDGNRRIDLADVGEFATEWLVNTAGAAADFDDSDNVDLDDLTILVERWLMEF